MIMNKKDIELVVLMSSFNGENYIADQIDSILTQKKNNIKLYIRDDGSTDATRSIITEYSKRYSNVIFINEGDSNNVGFNRSFMLLLSKALVLEPECELFAFADQDDIWMENKLSIAVDRILNTGNDNELMYYYANKYWTNAELKIIQQDDFSYCRDNYFDMFILPPVYGCTSIINRSLAVESLKYYKDASLLYDVYIFRLACLLGANIISEHTPVMYYRRHGNNVSGESMKFSIKRSIFQYLKSPKNLHGMRRYLEPIYLDCNKIMPDDQKKLCELILNNKNDRFRVLKLVGWRNAHDRGIKSSVMWIGRIILGAI